MAILDIFKRKGTIAGEVLVHGLPPHKRYCVNVTFFSVSSASSPPPFDADPPADKWIDTESVKEVEESDDKPLRFSFQRAGGYYYLGVGVIAFLERGGDMFAQVERFFPMSRPCQIQPGGEQQIRLAITWPDIPFGQLHTYGTVYQRREVPPVERELDARNCDVLISGVWKEAAGFYRALGCASPDAVLLRQRLMGAQEERSVFEREHSKVVRQLKIKQRVWILTDPSHH